MGFLERFENLIQRAVEGGTSSVLRNKLQPVEIEQKLERAMQSNTQSSRGGRIAPTSYTVLLHPDTFRETIAGVEGYSRHCEMLLNQYASQQGYTLLHQRIGVRFDTDANLGRRDVRIETAFAAPPSAAHTQHPQPSQAYNQTQVIQRGYGGHQYALVILRGEQQGRRFEIAEGENHIGRSPENTIVLNDDLNSVSRQHAVLTRRGNELRLRDVGSKNGTKVNGNYIPSHLETIIAPGAEISFGACVTRIG